MNTNELLQVANTALLSITTRPDIVMVKGEDMTLWDSEGKKYLDFIGGWAVNSLGHSPVVISQVLSEQASKLLNASPAFYNEPQLEYAELLINNCCMDRVFFTSTGAEANEGAIKLARKHGKLTKNNAYDVITTNKGFHGRTMTTMAATGKEDWQKMFTVAAPGFKKGEFNNLDSIKALVDDNTCAIMLEPVQGEGGVNVASREFMTGLRTLCDRENILLIFDEVQTGMGRTGKLFAYEHYGIEPDIITLGKGIGGGFPLSALLAKEFLNIFENGEQGGTYTGQPLAMAVGHAVLKEMLKEEFLLHCQAMSDYIVDQLQALSKQYEINNIRGQGLLLAFDLEQSMGADVVAQCRDAGLLINAPQPSSIRLIPPLIVQKKHIDEMFSVLKQFLKQH